MSDAEPRAEASPASAPSSGWLPSSSRPHLRGWTCPVGRRGYFLGVDFSTDGLHARVVLEHGSVAETLVQAWRNEPGAIEDWALGFDDLVPAMVHAVQHLLADLKPTRDCPIPPPSFRHGAFPDGLSATDPFDQPGTEP